MLQGPSGVQAWPRADPYEEIYKVRDKWWGLIKEEWLAPKDGRPIQWGEFIDNVGMARDFHDHLSGKYHPTTYVFYGADAKQPSFERVNWRMRRGLPPDSRQPPNAAQVLGMSPQQVRMDGTTPEYVGGQHETEVVATPEGAVTVEYESSYWELHCEKHDGIGDGTVPDSSGRSPKERGGASVKQQFRLTGFAHEPAFKNGTAQRATVYAITKIAGTAKIAT